MRFLKPSKYHNKKTEVGGVKFDSKLEAYCHSRFKQLNIKFDFQVWIELIPKFSYNNEKIRASRMRIDFIVYSKNKTIYCDTKGIATTEAKLKFKMLKNKIKDEENTEVLWFKNQKEVNQFLIENYEEN